MVTIKMVLYGVKQFKADLPYRGHVALGRAVGNTGNYKKQLACAEPEPILKDVVLNLGNPNSLICHIHTMSGLATTNVTLTAVWAIFAATIARQQKQIEALTSGLQKVSAQLAAASPSDAGLEAGKFGTGRIRGGGPAPQVVNND